MPTAVIFPGQGTQRPGMGEPWRDHVSWGVVTKAEALLGEDLTQLLLDDAPEALNTTRGAQLAVLLTSLMAWEASKGSVEACAFAGHSLGQVTALIASNALSFDDGIAFAAHRADLTQAAANARPGRMAALLGATIEQAEAACDVAPDACWIANDNAPGQVVLAGTPEGLETALAAAKELGVRRTTALDVGGAFHTPLMESATNGLTKYLENTQFNFPSAVIVSNHDGNAYDQPDALTALSASHVSVPVRWRTVQSTLAALGADTFLQIGDGAMLASLAKRTVPEIAVYTVANPEDVGILV
ncbi:MAG: ACP S-malonyltransferase [Acidimicrobiia bacterium]|nr:ACP S-malonyltransferase [Acidimicrobiia bacterium]